MKHRQRNGTAAALGTAAVAFVKRPMVIVVELALFGAASAIAASIPQVPADEDIRAFREAWPRLGAVTGALGLHDVVSSRWFLAIVGLCLASLLAVQLDQWRRVRRLWQVKLEASSFQRAPFRREYPHHGAVATPRFRTTGRASILGSPIFHLGLVTIALAGLVRLLTFRDAAIRAVEGETLATAPDVFEAQRGGALSRPIVLPRAVRIDEIGTTRYASGALKGLVARVAVAGDAGSEPRELAVNAPLDLGDVRLYASTAFGVVAALESRTASGATPLLAWLEPRDDQFRGGLRPSPGFELRLRTLARKGAPTVELRVVHEGVLESVTELSPGAELQLDPGHALRVLAVKRWVQLRATRDPSRPLFFGGLLAGLLGLVLMLGATRVDEGIFVEGDRLVVALRPHRHAPLYAERFEALCRDRESAT